MKYLLDTNAVIAINKDKIFNQNLRKHHVKDIAISIITLFELYYGAYKGSADYLERNLAKIATLPFTVLHLTDEDVRQAGLVRVLTKQQPIGAYDILIAGQALARDLTLVTHNTREFLRVPELLVEDWQVE